MTQTIQPCSFAMLGETNRTLTGDDISALSSLHDKLISLCGKLRKLNHIQNILLEELREMDCLIYGK